jgi:probable AcnD-accessory protein PrpF
MNKQIRVRATYMRGGTSKGVFISQEDLPPAARQDASLRDQLLMRVVGSPDPYEKHIDGMGGATSSTSKVVIVSKSARADCDVDYLFGAVSIESALIDWSGNCGNLTTAVGPFAIDRKMIAAPENGTAVVRIWQANIGKRIVAHVPMRDGEVVEMGDFELDGVPFPAAEIRLEFMDPGGDEGDEGGALFATGQPAEIMDVPGVGRIEATLINAGNPTVFVRADAFGLCGTELQADINTNPELLAKLEAVRAWATCRMGLASSPEEATLKRPATPKIAMVASPQAYVASNGKPVAQERIDVLVRILSMGKLHHAITGTGAVAVAAAAAIPRTVVAKAVGPGAAASIRIGHPSGTLTVGAQATSDGGAGWVVNKVVLSRSARRLMDGWVLVPETGEGGRG